MLFLTDSAEETAPGGLPKIFFFDGMVVGAVFFGVNEPMTFQDVFFFPMEKIEAVISGFFY